MPTNAQSNLTTSNNQTRTDAYAALTQATNESNAAYAAATNAAFTAWGTVTAAALDMATAANNANGAAVVASGNALNNMDAQLNAIAAALAQADIDTTAAQTQIGTQSGNETATRPNTWNNVAVTSMSNEPSWFDGYCHYFWNPDADFAPYQNAAWYVAGGALALAGGLYIAPAVGAAYTLAGQAGYAYAYAYAPFVLTQLGAGALGLGITYLVTGDAGLSINIALGFAGVAPGAPNTQITVPSTLRLSDKQFGQKMAQRARELGLDPGSPQVRFGLRSRIQRIFDNADETRIGIFRGQGANNTEGPVLFFRRGYDVVVTTPDGDFITLLVNGIRNSRFINGTPLP